MLARAERSCSRFVTLCFSPGAPPLSRCGSTAAEGPVGLLFTDFMAHLFSNLDPVTHFLQPYPAGPAVNRLRPVCPPRRIAISQSPDPVSLRPTSSVSPTSGSSTGVSRSQIRQRAELPIGPTLETVVMDSPRCAFDVSVIMQESSGSDGSGADDFCAHLSLPTMPFSAAP